MKKITIFGHELHRHYFSLLLVPLILILTFIFHEDHAVIYVPFSCAVCAMIIFVNFPSIVIMLHSRPVYYDDLVIKSYNEDEVPSLYDDAFRKKYQKIFLWLSTVTSALMVALKVEMWFYRDRLFSGEKDVVNSLAALGIIGGILRIYYTATMALGRFIMFVLKVLKKREQEKLMKITDQRARIELNSIGIVIKDDTENSTDEQLLPVNPDFRQGVILKERAMVDLFNNS